jgi:hypothetical protein
MDLEKMHDVTYEVKTLKLGGKDTLWFNVFSEGFQVFGAPMYQVCPEFKKRVAQLAFRPKILVVDDEKDILEIIEEALEENEGYEIIPCDDSFEAWKLMYEKGDQIECAIFDVFIDNCLSGHFLREYASKRGIPSLIYTGGAKGDQPNEYTLMKPAPLSDIRKMVRDKIAG